MASHQPDFGAVIARITRALRARRVDFMLIGGQAVLIHGEPRLTQDIDITLAATPDKLDVLVDACRTAELDPIPQDLHEFVRRTFVLPASSREGIRVDFIFSSTAYEAEAIRRAAPIEIAGELVPFATAEDLLIHKLFAGRPRDLEDAGAIVRRRRSVLDWDYVEHWIRQFAVVPGREDLIVKLQHLRDHA